MGCECFLEHSLWKAITAIRSGHPLKVYLIYAETDGYANKWISAELQKYIASSVHTEVEVVRQSLLRTPLQSVVSEAFEGSLFDAQWVASCSDFDFLNTTYKGRQADSDFADTLEALLAEPPRHCLVLHTEGGKLDERKKITKRFFASPHVCVIHAARHSKDETQTMMREIAGNELLFSDHQLAMLFERTGNSFGRFALETEKIKLYAEGRSGITDAELDELVADERVPDVFEVVRLIVTNHPAKAYNLYKRMGPSESFFALLSLLSRQYRLILRVRDESAKGRPDAQLAAQFGVHPYACKVAREQGRNVTDEDGKTQLMRLAELEYQIKSGQLTEKTAVELYFLRLLSYA